MNKNTTKIKRCSEETLKVELKPGGKTHFKPGGLNISMDHHYFLVKLELSDPASQSDLDLSLSYLSNNITFALKKVFGEIGAAVPINVLKFEPKSSNLIVECPSDWVVKVRAALTLQTTYQGQACAYQVLKQGHTLFQLTQ